MKLPIFVDARSEMLVFSSVTKAEDYLESIDVENKEYGAAYDSEGRIFNITTSGQNIRLTLLEEEPLHEEELRRKLINFLNYISVEGITDVDLPYLVNICIEHVDVDP